MELFSQRESDRDVPGASDSDELDEGVHSRGKAVVEKV